MAVAVRNSGLLRTTWFAGGALPFSPLLTSTLVMFALSRDAAGATFGGTTTPPGWTLVHTRYTANDAFGIFTAPASVGSVGSCPADIGNPTGARVLYELTGADAAGVAAGSTGGQFGASSTAGPAATPPATIGKQALALALLMGTTGDPAPGCYWSNLAPWTKDQCDCHTAGGNHPWYATYSRGYASAPASVSDLFTNSVAQATQGAVLIVPAARSVGAFAGEPGGGIW